ncbi:MAG: Maf family protein [Succinivibrio sp.]
MKKTSTDQKKIILASSSPRRQEYMRYLGLPFIIQKPMVDENAKEDELPQDLVKRLSLLKAEAVAKDNPDAVIVAADTVVSIDDEVLGKPLNDNDAFLMLKKLSNRTHTVYTGTVIRYKDEIKSFVSSCKVTFASLTDDEIKTYVSSGECSDKAGSYALQGMASMFIKEVCGSVSTVVGLPICEVREALRYFGLPITSVKAND